MSNYFEFNDKFAFHPGYYVKELIDELGITQEDFAKRLNTSPKTISLLVRGEQNLTSDLAKKLSSMFGTSINYWLNLQSSYDALIAEFEQQQELEREREIFKHIDYLYFRDNFGLPDLKRQVDEQVKYVRKKLGVSTLCVLAQKDMAVNFRGSSRFCKEENIIKANIMVQIAINETLKESLPAFNKKKFSDAIEYALTLTGNHNEFYPLIRKAFGEAGVNLVVLPNMPGSNINGATRKVNNNIVLMVNDRKTYSDTFWFTLFHEIGHIMNGDYCASFDKETGEQEDKANKYAAEKLIPQSMYSEFLKKGDFSINSIKSFADEIKRDIGIILGRLQNDSYISYTNSEAHRLRHRYKIVNG